MMGTEDARDRTGEPFLAAEMVGQEIRMTIPTDLLVAKMLLNELTYRIHQAEITQGFALRDSMAKMQPRGANGVSLASADTLKRLRR